MGEKDVEFWEKKSLRIIIFSLRRNWTPNQKLACFVVYLKIGNTSLQNVVFILKQIVQGLWFVRQYQLKCTPVDKVNHVDGHFYRPTPKQNWNTVDQRFKRDPFCRRIGSEVQKETLTSTVVK